MQETRFTEFPALSVDSRVRIPGSASEIGLIIFLTYNIKNNYLHESFMVSFIFLTFYVKVTSLTSSDVTSEIYSSDVAFNVAYELSQPMGETELSSTAKIEQICHTGKKRLLGPGKTRGYPYPVCREMCCLHRPIYHYDKILRYMSCKNVSYGTMTCVFFFEYCSFLIFKTNEQMDCLWF